MATQNFDEDLLSLGDKFYTEGNIAKALKIYGELNQKFPNDYRPKSAMATCYKNMIPLFYATSTEVGDTVKYISYAELALFYAEDGAELLLEQHNEIDDDFYHITWTLNQIIDIQWSKLALGSKYYMDSQGKDKFELESFNFDLFKILKKYYKTGSSEFDKLVDEIEKISTSSQYH